MMLMCSLESRSIVNMLVISFKGFGNLLYSRFLCKSGCFILNMIFIVGRNAKIFEEMEINRGYVGFDLLLLLRGFDH